MYLFRVFMIIVNDGTQTFQVQAGFFPRKWSRRPSREEKSPLPPGPTGEPPLLTAASRFESRRRSLWTCKSKGLSAGGILERICTLKGTATRICTSPKRR